MSQEPTRTERDWAKRLAPFMFYLSLLFLALIAAALVLWVDVDRVVDPIEVDLGEDGSFRETLRLSEKEIAFEDAAHRYGDICVWALLVLWPFFWAEQIYLLLRAQSFTTFRRSHPFFWLFLVFPPLRLCAQFRSEEHPQVWLPQLGWQTIDRELRRRLEREFSIPMIGIALMILPVLGLQFIFKDRIVDYPTLRILLHIGTGLIWFAFSVEFIVMVSVARSKLDYCKRHWLDLAIILLPFISFLRSLRVVRAYRLVSVGRLTQMSKMVRVYRLRGVAMRAFRALLVLEVIHRLLRTTPEKRIASLERQRAEKLRELEDIDEQIEALKSQQQPQDSVPTSPDT